MTADATFAMAGRLIQEAMDAPFNVRLKALSVCMPLALKRIPDRTISTVTSYNISEETARAMLAEAHCNLLIYKELDEEAKREKALNNKHNNNESSSTSDNV